MIDLKLLKSTLNVSQDGLFIAELRDKNLGFVYVNQAFEDITGLSIDAPFERLFADIVDEGYQGDTRRSWESAVQQRCDGELRLKCQNDHARISWVSFQWQFIENDELTYLVGSFKDITQEEYAKNVMEKVNYLFREMSRRLEYTNETDQLTKLKNRGHLCTRGEFLLGAAKREQLRIHAIVIDVDNFKFLNSVGGAGLGDECLITVADLLGRYFCRATDIAIRMCDDEFVVICIEDDDRKVLERIEAFRQDVANTKIRDIDSRLHDISVSVGVHSVTPEKRTTLDDMIHQAGELVFTRTNTIGNRVTHISDLQRRKRLGH